MLLVCCPCPPKALTGASPSSGKVFGFFQTTWDGNIRKRRLIQRSHFRIEPVTFVANFTPLTSRPKW